MENKLLTLSEMVHYEIPSDYSMYMPGTNNINSGWNLPNFFPCSLINRSKSNYSAKLSYAGVLRDKQKRLLSISGRTKRNQRKSASQSRPQIPSVSPNASGLKKQNKKKNSNSFLSISTSRRNTVNIMPKIQTPSVNTLASNKLAKRLNKINGKRYSDILSITSKNFSPNSMK